MADDGGWSRIWDDHEQHWYWYNDLTQESIWEEDENGKTENSPNIGVEIDGQAEQEKVETAPQHHDNWNDVQTQWKKLGMIDAKHEQNYNFNQSRVHPTLARDSHNHEYDSTESENEDENLDFKSNIQSHPHSKADSLEDQLKKKGVNSKKLNRYHSVLAETNSVVSWYKNCFYCHGVLIEAPLTIAEGLIRGALCLALALILFLFSSLLYCAGPILTSKMGSKEEVKARTFYMHKRSFYLARIWGREGLLFLASAFSLTIVPCTIVAYVYKNFSVDGDEEGRWDISPLPSVLGLIDPRRFASIVLCGQGGDAANADMPLLASDDPSSIEMRSTESNFTSITKQPGNNQSALEIEAVKPIGFQGGMDAWKGPVLLPPRNLDRGLPPLFATLVKALLSLFIDKDEDYRSGIELLPTHDDEEEEEEEENEETKEGV